MTRNTHDLVNDHFGTLSDAQIATGTATTGDAPLSNGDGTRTWGAVAGGLADLLTGNDANFTASVGSWTSSSGAVTRDTAYKIVGTTASLKWAAAAGAQYVEVPISGTFRAGKPYAALVYLSVEDTDDAYRTVNVRLGVPGTDSTYNPVAWQSSAGRPGVGSGNFIAASVFWTPTADRTTVKLRVETSDAPTLHVGIARAWQTPTFGVFTAGTAVPAHPTEYGDIHLNPWGNTYGVVVRPDGSALVINSDNTVGLSVGRPNDNYAYCWAEHAAADLSYKGYEFDVGTDYLPFCVSEKDAGTVQIYGYDDQDFELRDLGTGHWLVTNPGDTLSKNLIEMEQRKASGTATVASGTTSITVTHGAGYTPSENDILITPTNSPTNDPGWWWLSSVGATTFTINVRNDPGAGGATFAWRVDR